MRDSDLAYLSALIGRHTAITLEPMRPAQVTARLVPVARRFGFRDPGALMQDLPHGHPRLLQAVLEAMTTNDTWFFRDRAVFDHLRDHVLPTLMARRMRSGRLRIWCAGVSSGQEAYTLAMILAEKNLVADWTIELIATDLSPVCISRARQGHYSNAEVQRGLGIKRLIAHFTQEAHGWRISPALRQIPRFHTFNLLDDYDWLGEIDLILCRNVLLYFALPTKAQVLDRLAAQLAPDGYLVVGSAEQPHTIASTFELVEGTRGLYSKAEADLRRASVR